MTETTPDVGTFSVLDYATKKAMPTDNITVYTDDAAAYELRRLQVEDSTETDPDRSNEIAAQIETLKERIRQSGLTFHLKGLPTKVHTDIMKEGMALFKITKDSDPETVLEAQDWANRKTIGLTIVQVERPDGSLDKTTWTPEAVEQLRESVLRTEEWTRLEQKVEEINLSALQFEQAVHADFS